MQAHLAPVMSVEEVHAVLAMLLTNNKIQRATHNMMAYRIHVPDRNTFLQAWAHACYMATLQFNLEVDFLRNVPCV